jgi:glycosyltransferase involved in cell wall biosynthesis
MRIAAHLGVKDEIDLIEKTIAHLRAIGVDLIIAVDSNSTDGTADVLNAFQSADEFWFVQMSDLEPDGTDKVWLRKNLELVQKADADWVIFLDADEYWIPASGSLKDCAALANADLLSVDRFNIALGPGGPMMPDELTPQRYDELLLFVEPVPDFRAHLQANPDTPWIRGVPVPKIMVRPERISAITDGMHDAVAGANVSLRRARPSDLLITHLPFTTRARFKRKVDNVRNVIAAHDEYFGKHLAWHWRHWLALAEQGRIDEEFDRQRLSVESIAQFRAAGVVRSAAEVFAERSREGHSGL